MAKKSKLDSAFLDDVTAGANMQMQVAHEWVLLDVSLIDANPYQPRFDEGDVQELARSISINGLQQPIKVCAGKNGRYTLLYGHRRLKAHKLLAKRKIRAIMGEADDRVLFNVAMIENFHRKDLSGLEYATKFQEALDQGMYKSRAELCDALSISESKMSKIMSLLHLDEKLKETIKRDDKPLGYTTLHEISKLEGSKQMQAYEQVKSGNITREQIKKAPEQKNGTISSLKCELKDGKAYLKGDDDFPLFEKFKQIVEDFNKQKEQE